jgi:predicted  nucleic acid-binding Zn-ribbon protein
MDWTQSLTIIGIFSAFFLYLMSRMDSNQKQMNEKMDSNQKQMNEKFEGINQRFNTLENRMTGMEVEMRGMNQRLSNVENCVMPRKVFHFEEPDHKDEPKEN